MKNLIVFVFIVMLITTLVVINGKENKLESQSYVLANDGEYVPVYKVRCTAERIKDIITVTWNGNEYEAYLDPESEIQTGDTITATFIICDGNVEFIGIE